LLEGDGGFILPVNVSIRARISRAEQHGRGYASPVFDSPPEGGGFQLELVSDKWAVVVVNCGRKK